MHATFKTVLPGLYLSLILSGIGPHTSFAQDEAEQQRAREYYSNGKVLYDQKQFTEALESFQAAYATKPHPTVLKSIAECQIQLGDLPGAVETFERYLATPKARGKKAIRKRMKQLKAQIATVDISSVPEGAGIVVDGNLTDRVTPATIKITSGDHQIALNAEGYEPLLKDVTLVGGQLSTIRVDFPSEGVVRPEPMPEPVAPEETAPEDEPTVVSEEDESGFRVPTSFWVCVGLAGATAINGMIFGIMTLNYEDDYHNAETDEEREKYEKGETFGVIADVSFGVAIGSAVVGGIILIASNVGDKKKELSSGNSPSLSVTPMAGNDTIGLNAALTF